MCYKVILLTLSVSVTARPQFFPQNFQRQYQFVPVVEPVFVEPYVDRALSFNSRINAAANQFFNPNQDIPRDVRGETGPKFERIMESNTEMLTSNLNRMEDNRNGAVTPNVNQFDSGNERNGEFVTPQPNNPPTHKRKHSHKNRHRGNNATNVMQNNPLPDNQDFNQNQRNTNKQLTTPSPNNQFVPSVNVPNYPNNPQDSKAFINTQYDNNNQPPRPTPEYRSNVNDDQNGQTVSDVNHNGSPSNSSSARPGLNEGRVAQEGRINEGSDEDEEKWVWGYSNVTEKVVTEMVVIAITPDVDDRANFDGGSCPTGKVKIGTMCVDKD
ncbi:putative uncharacterized protein DDB_G0282133 [Ostrinia furnacalis]|uniref:putative uncharacterized protein DDB_G0282133 n=1 Tax=Ostrinia furnacalis TaxID=93504 RepID=UPI00103EAFDE|nr:putative uncharacterized protein DDB_G0282133 [Ostrinia furnacalis]